MAKKSVASKAVLSKTTENKKVSKKDTIVSKNKTVVKATKQADTIKNLPKSATANKSSKKTSTTNSKQTTLNATNKSKLKTTITPKGSESIKKKETVKNQLIVPVVEQQDKQKRKYTKRAEKTTTQSKIEIPLKQIEVKVATDKPRQVKSILISLPKPETGKSPYIDLANHFKIKLDWRPFTQVQAIKANDFRLQRIYLNQYKNIIFTSKTAIEQYFKMNEEMRLKVSPENKYYCINEAIALYLQKYIQYRKRKVFFGDGKLQKLVEVIIKSREKDGDKLFLIPSSETKDKALTDVLRTFNIEYKEAILYKTIASNLSDLKNVKYDMLVFFNPSAIDSLYSNFPDFVQEKTRLAIFGNLTAETVMKRKLRIDVFAPTPQMPSLVDAIKKYISLGNKK